MSERTVNEDSVLAACPLGPLASLEKDSRDLYFEHISKKPYQGQLRPVGSLGDWRSWDIVRLARDFLVYRGIWHRAAPGPEIVWRQAEDDVNFLSFKLGYKPRMSPRHFHADFGFEGRPFHIDFIKFLQWGPLSGVLEFVVFSDGRFMTRGGHCGVPPAGGRYNWPLAIPTDRSLIILEDPLGLTDMEFSGPKASFWIEWGPANSGTQYHFPIFI